MTSPRIPDLVELARKARGNPVDTLQLVRVLSESWPRIELEEVELDDGVVHAVIDLCCDEGEEELDETAVTLWVIRILNALAQTPTAQLTFRGRGWGRRGQLPPPLALDPDQEGVVVDSSHGTVVIAIALPLHDPDTPRIVWALSDLDVAKLEKGLQRFCISKKAKGEREPTGYAKPPPKPVTVPTSPPVDKPRRKAAKKRAPTKKPGSKKRAKKTTKRRPRPEPDLIEMARKARGNPPESAAQIDRIKQRLLAWNPLPVLPVVKRGIYPQLIVGQYGESAYYKYRDWSIDVRRPVRDRMWDVTVTPPSSMSRETRHSTSTTFDGGVCAGKIIVDLTETLDTIQPQSDSYHLIFFWQTLYQIAQRQMKEYGRATRASVARRLETDRKAGDWRPHAHAWWDKLPLPQRIQLIDDRLELAYCMYGTDWRDWPEA